ncbi:hypothetical protein BGW80DRAFT_1559158 [Lactifluus volemus]|nr:hypothetical protein BGW80DRAFT_1559158 [Lactifluus volemus]
MTSFILGRVLLRSGSFPTAQIFATRPIFSNRRLTWVMQRDLVTTRDFSSGPTADSESELESKPGRKAGASSNVAGKSKNKSNAMHSTKAEKKKKKKIKIEPKDLPPSRPGSAFILWYRDWYRSLPKAENIQTAQKNAATGAQIWHALPDHDKQQYREKFNDLRTEYKQRLDEWRENIDPAIVRELNRRRVSKGLNRIRSAGDGRPMSGFLRYIRQVWEENPRTEGDHPAHFKAMSERASSQWKAMSDAEKAKYNDPAKDDFAAWRERRKAKSH